MNHASGPQPNTVTAPGDDVRVDGDDELLLGVLERYLAEREQGPVDHERFIEQHADLAGQLSGLLTSIDALHDLSPDSSFSVFEWGSLTSLGWQDLVSKTLGDYHIVRELGRGGMGIVYEAQQQSLDRRVALKVLPLSVVLDEQQIARFMIEAQAAAQLHHPNIVPIFSVGQEEGVHCYSMPLIDGVTLDRRIKEESDVADVRRSRTRETVDQSVRLMVQTALALDHAHQRGVIHRDIKPSNLMVDRNGKVWVTDFGLARCRTNASLTQSGAIVGTVRYMSPEQASGSETVDHRSDIYSLGVTMYELLTGKSAVDNASRLGILAHRQLPDPVRPRRLNPFITRDLETIVLKSIAQPVGQRYQSARDMADDLQRYLDGKPILARRPSIADRVTKWTARHHKTVAAAVALSFLALVASLVATAIYANQQRNLTAALADADANLLASKANHRKTREVLDHFGLMAAERLRGVAGAESIREDLVRDLLAYYEDFVRQASDDPRLREELASTHFRAAQIIEEVGASKQAKQAYLRAVELYSQLTEPTDETQFQLGLCRNNLAAVQADAGDYDPATENYHRAMELLAPLLGRHNDARRELANTHGNFGLLLSATGDTEAARRELEFSLRLLQEDRRHESDHRLPIALTLNNLGYLYQDSDLPRALRYNDRAITVLREVAHSAEVPDDVQQQLAISLNNRASLLRRLERHSEALSVYGEALAVYRVLVDRSPLVIRYTEELAITYNNFGRLLMQSGNKADARLSFDRSRDLLELLVRRRPDESRYAASLGGVLNNLARVSLQSGQLNRAIAEYETSIEMQEEILAAGNGTPAHRGVLLTTYANYERALRDCGRWQDAEKVKLLRTSF